MINKQLGYYVVDGREFASKIEACVYAQQVNKEVIWLFNREVFDVFDWTVEPDESIVELYDKRARELREKYDYIAISYSGGVDSHNLLMSFIRQKLHVDEILVNVFEKANKTIVNDVNETASWNYGAEYALQIYPRLNEIRNLIPQTKISVVDISDQVFELFRNTGDASWVLNQKEVLNPSGITRYNYLYFKDIRNKFDKLNSIGIVFGVEKPMVYIENGKFYMLFIDKGANITSVQNHFDEYSNTSVEYFYWHPDCAKLLAKQAHLIKNWLESNPQLIPMWTIKTMADVYANGNMKRELIRDVVYPNVWDKNWFQTVKGTKFWKDEIDTWFFKLYGDTDEYRVWSEGVQWVKDNARSFVNQDTQDNFIAHGRKYYIGDVKANLIL